MNLGQLYYEIDRICKDKAQVSGLFKANGELITPEK